MSLKKKIILSFAFSAIIIAILAGLEYVNYIKIRKEIRYLEITDTIRSKSLELRRHEKNFLLRADIGQIRIVYDYINELQQILDRNQLFYNEEKFLRMHDVIDKYEYTFNLIEKAFWNFQEEFARIKPSNSKYAMFFPLIESTFLERPVVNAELLEKVFLIGRDEPAVQYLIELDSQISALRIIGENSINISKELDRKARENVDGYIDLSQRAILFFFPLFVVVGIGLFLFVISNVVKRLQVLTEVVENAGKGYFTQMSEVPAKWIGSDEVGILTHKFNNMELQLEQRENELLQSKKLAAIGTFASGVAHELNNPLNNIYTSAQRLLKKTGGDCPDFLVKGLDDIFGQTMRVKKIVGDLLEFARGREPHFREVELNNLISSVYERTINIIDAGGIEFSLDSAPDGVYIEADHEQIEQVFINLFTNAIEVMSGKGTLNVKIDTVNDDLTIRVADSGKGMTQETADKIFEPFFTTKDKGTGLGLAIVFSIIQKHKGSIRVESEEGRGTAFVITLQRRKQG